MKVKKQLTAGRPKTAVNKAEGPAQPLKPKAPAAPKVSTNSELPKEIIGSHMGTMMPQVTVPKPLNVGKPAPSAPRPRKMPV